MSLPHSQGGPAARAARRCRAPLLALACAVLAACTTGPEYQRPEVPLPASWRVDLQDAADLANTEWWKAFGDPDLDRLVEAAIDANLDLKLATHRIEEFDARLQVSRSENYPRVGYGAALGREKRSQERPNGLQPGVSPYVENYEVSATFTWELDLWGRVKRSNEAARANLLANQEARRGVMLTVVSAVAASYVQLLELDVRLAVARQTLKNREDALALVQTRFEGGSATRLAVEQARADIEAEAAQIPMIEREIATLENAVSVLLGRSTARVPRRQLDALGLPQMPQGVPADVLTRRPDVMVAEQNLIAANARIGVAMTGYFPTVSLPAAIGLGADDPRWLWSKPARFGGFAANIAGTLFDAGRTEGDIRQAEATQKQMVVMFQQAVQNALREVDDALVTRTKAGEREAALARRVALLEEVLRLTVLRFEGGQSTQKDVLDAQTRLYEAQGLRAQGRRDALLALVGVYRAMGGGWMVEQEKRQAQPAVLPEAQARAANEARASR